MIKLYVNTINEILINKIHTHKSFANLTTPDLAKTPKIHKFTEALKLI